MSETSARPGWWIASDGKWYPPELHPSVRDAHPGQTSGTEGGATQSHYAQDRAASEAHVGPRFPDMFQVALQGSHCADAVSVKYDGDDERNGHPSAVDARTPRSGMSSPGSARARATADVGAGGTAGAIGDFSGASANRRRWRKGH